ALVAPGAVARPLAPAYGRGRLSVPARLRKEPSRPLAQPAERRRRGVLAGSPRAALEERRQPGITGSRRAEGRVQGHGAGRVLRGVLEARAPARGRRGGGAAGLRRRRDSARSAAARGPHPAEEERDLCVADGRRFQGGGGGEAEQGEARERARGPEVLRGLVQP